MKISIVLALVISGVNCLAQHSSYTQTLPDTQVSFKMIAIPGGTFLLGDEGAGIPGEADERPAKKVTLDPFWLEEHEVTFAEWDLFFKNLDVPQSKNIVVDAVSRPTPQYIDLTWGMGRDAKQPANSMSQAAAIMYCKWLYEKTGFFYRLPTEAEWEYACKAGGQSPSPDQLTQFGYASANSQTKFKPVMQLKPNRFGLYDMLGNLSEWTLDQYDPLWLENLTQTKNPVNPPASKYPRVTKGGSFQDDFRALRCSNRIPSNADWNKRDPQIPKSRWWLTDGMFVGFRVARPVVQPDKKAIDAFYALYLK